MHPPDDDNRERSSEQRGGPPSEGSVVRDRFSSDEIFQRIIAAAEEEITEGRRELFFSAVAGGFAIIITVLVYASLLATTSPTNEFADANRVVASMLYPIGFIYIIIGGYQLYTENTLPPVALTLERLASFPALFRNWSIVALGNFTGGAIGALVLAHTGVLSPEAFGMVEYLGQKGIEEPVWNLFFKGAVAGLIVAGVVWVEYASRDTISRLVVVYLAFLCIPLGNLYHVVVSFTEMIFLLSLGQVGAATGMLQFVIPSFWATRSVVSSSLRSSTTTRPARDDSDRWTTTERSVASHLPSGRSGVWSAGSTSRCWTPTVAHTTRARVTESWFPSRIPEPSLGSSNLPTQSPASTRTSPSISSTSCRCQTG